MKDVSYKLLVPRAVVGSARKPCYPHLARLEWRVHGERYVRTYYIQTAIGSGAVTHGQSFMNNSSKEKLLLTSYLVIE